MFVRPKKAAAVIPTRSARYGRNIIQIMLYSPLTSVREQPFVVKTTVCGFFLGKGGNRMQMTQESIDTFLESQQENGASVESLRQRRALSPCCIAGSRRIRS